MFKLIAVRALEGCRESAIKCLKIGKLYYLCNDYIISDQGIEFRDEYVKTLPEDFFTLHSPMGLQINISAIVGMNGDGKSSLVELIMRLINNCAKHYKLADRDNLLKVEGIKAELFYIIDNIVYCIRETLEDNHTRLIKFADLSDSTIRKWQSINKPVKSVSRMRELFYTIISNYSLYAYNTNDFQDE